MAQYTSRLHQDEACRHDGDSLADAAIVYHTRHSHVMLISHMKHHTTSAPSLPDNISYYSCLAVLFHVKTCRRATTFAHIANQYAFNARRIAKKWHCLTHQRRQYELTARTVRQ